MYSVISTKTISFFDVAPCRNKTCIVDNKHLYSHTQTSTHETTSCRPYKILITCGNQTRDTQRSSLSFGHWTNCAIILIFY